jgi:hypothetical protein
MVLSAEVEPQNRSRVLIDIVQMLPKALTHRIMRFDDSGTPLEKALILYSLWKEPTEPEDESILLQSIDTHDLTERMMSLEAKPGHLAGFEHCPIRCDNSLRLKFMVCSLRTRLCAFRPVSLHS